MALIVGHDGAKVGVGIADVDRGRVCALDVDRRGSGRRGDNKLRWCADLNGGRAGESNV